MRSTYQVSCPQCRKPAVTEKTFTISNEIVHRLQCGHMMREAQISKKDPANLISLDRKRLFNFQCDGVKFIEASNGRALIADEMGIGKTVQSLGFISLHPEVQPVLYIVKSALKMQWQKEIMRWCSPNSEDLEFAPIITDQHSMVKGFKHYIVSFDLLRRLVGSDNGSRDEDGGLLPLKQKPNIIQKLGIKTIVIDECQAIKNPQATRTIEVRSLARDPQIKNVIALSGTPIKNNAAEYYSVLNILRPDLYNNYSHFTTYECQSNWNGYSYKVGGLRDPERFMEKTKGFILRRERKDVLPDLPQITRNYQFSELGAAVENAYRDAFIEFQDSYDDDDNSFQSASHTLAYLSKMRHLTGLSKVDPCIDFVEEFLESSDRKLTIFNHHKDVGELLNLKLSRILKKLDLPAPLMLTSDLNTDQRAEIVDKFMQDNGPRILIGSTLASGEGLNLQKCSDCIMLERQWNPANEEQAEGRFIRIGQLSDKVTATYLVAVGTVDEFFAEIVEQKREIVASTLGGVATKWDQSSLMKELAERLALQGGKKWGL